MSKFAFSVLWRMQQIISQRCTNVAVSFCCYLFTWQRISHNPSAHLPLHKGGFTRLHF